MGRFSQPQVTHNDDYHLTTAKRDTANGVCGIDAAKEVINDVPIAKIVDMKNQSFENIVDNGDFETWSAGSSSAPDGWTTSGAGVSVAVEDTIIKIGTHSCKLLRGIGTSQLRHQITNYRRYAGKSITLECLVHADIASNARLTLYDGVSYTDSSYHSGGSGWELLSITKELDGSCSQLLIMVSNSVNSSSSYFDGLMAVEGTICPAFSLKPLYDSASYGEMYIYNNSTATVLETADTPIALRQISEGLQNGFIFHAGSTGAITAYADYSGTEAGTVLVTDAGHGLATGDIITIRGTTNYNGIFEITKVSADTFYITDTWVDDNGASDWDQGASLTAQVGAGGVYTSTWQMTTAPAGACELCFKVNVNETPQDKSTACRDMAINDKDNNSSTCLLTIVEGDIIWLSVESDSTDNITNSMGNMNLERM